MTLQGIDSVRRPSAAQPAQVPIGPALPAADPTDQVEPHASIAAPPPQPLPLADVGHQGALQAAGVMLPLSPPPPGLSLDKLAPDYDGPIFISDVTGTLTDPAHLGMPYVGTPQILRGIADMGLPIVYLASTAAEKTAVSKFPAGAVLGPPTDPKAVDPFKLQTLQELKTRFPDAHLFALGNDRDRDAGLYQQAGVHSWIRNLNADQANIPAGFDGVIRDVYSPLLISNILNTVAAARAQSASLGHRGPVGRIPDLGPNPPPGLPPASGLGQVVATGRKVGHLAHDGAKLIEGWVAEHLRGGLSPVKFAGGQSDTQLSSLNADALGTLAQRVIDHRSDPQASAQFMRLLTAHGRDAGHVVAILHEMTHFDAWKKLAPAARAQVSDLLWDDRPARPGDWNGFQQYVDSATGTTPRPGSKVEPFINGQEAFPRMLSAVDSARQSVNWSVYAFQSDETGWEVARHLAAAADRGCQVRLLYDVDGSRTSNGSPTDPKIYQFLKDHKVDIIARPDGPLNTEKTHRKLLVVDGNVGFLGGMNVGNEYRNEWHDVQARMTGPVVADTQHLFVHQWQTEGGHIDDPQVLFPPLTEQPSAGSARALGHDGRNDERMKLTYLRAIDTAEHTINIADPYFADEDVLDHLKAAAQRGVQVNLVFPYQNDLAIQQDWERNHYPELLAAGVHIHEYYGREMAHDKVATFDGKISTIGSSNLDQESLYANYEANVWSSDPGVAQHLDQALFAADLKQSYPITEWKPGLMDRVKGEILDLLQKRWL